MKNEVASYAKPDEQFRRLVRPKRRGLLSLVFSRFFIFAILIMLQIGILLALIAFTKEHISNYLILERTFAFIMIAYLFWCPMDASAKLTWMLIISLSPVAGTVFLLFTQINFGNRYLKKILNNIIADSDDILSQPDGVLEELHEAGDHTDDLVMYLNRSGCFPVYKDTEVTYFPSGEAKFRAMLEELEKAEKYIFMEYFIIGEGYMWGKILDILIRKAEEGVKVRVMYDGMCEIHTLTPDYFKRLSRFGIEAKPFSPIMPFISSHYNYRDHRKILVIDGKTAFTGGVNLADEYINRIRKFGHWKDAAIRLRGEAVKSFELMFLQMWNIGGSVDDIKTYLGQEAAGADKADTDAEQGNADAAAKYIASGGYVVPFCDSPLDGDKVGETVYMDIMNRAGTYVHIMTPYLILDGQLEASIRYAAQRGIDVKIILPGIPDKKMVYALAKSHYRRLIDAGVHIYEYTPGFVHSKVFVSDDIKAVVGTINLDYRSLYHHFECAAYLFRNESIADIEKDFDETLRECREVTYESIRNEKLFYKIAGGIMKFVAPLM